MSDLRQPPHGERLPQVAGGVRGQDEHLLEGGPRVCQELRPGQGEGEHLADGLHLRADRV